MSGRSGQESRLEKRKGKKLSTGRQKKAAALSFVITDVAAGKKK